MKSLTVDVVVTGDESAALAAAVDAVRRGQRVHVVLRSSGSRVMPRLRRVCRADKVDDRELTVSTNAEVVCVDGVDGVEAVVIRDARTGRLSAVNASAVVSCGDSRNRPDGR